MDNLTRVLKDIRFSTRIDIPEEFKADIEREVLIWNNRYERILSLILIGITSLWLLVSIVVSEFWSLNIQNFAPFPYIHIILLMMLILFLALSQYISKLQPRVLKLINLIYNILILSLCVLSDFKHYTQPFNYILSVFCIASMILVTSYERILFIVPFILYLIGIYLTGGSVQDSLEEIFFLTLLTILALKFSIVHYNSFIINYINIKTVLKLNEGLVSAEIGLRKALTNSTEELNKINVHNDASAEFLSNISHDLRTPLNIISATIQMTEVFINESDDLSNISDLSNYTRIMKQNCYRLIRLIDNLIDVNKINSDNFELNLQNCNIVNLVEELTLSIKSFTESKGLTLVFDTDTEEKIISCDPENIERIILNLLSNAIKYTQPGGKITVSIFDKGSWVEIHVSDTGIGIPADKLSSIFERFKQADQPPEKKREGSGLGLAIVKSLTDRHSGEVKVLSEVGKGSTFIIKLPSNVLALQNSDVAEDGRIRNHNQKISVEFSEIDKQQQTHLWNKS